VINAANGKEKRHSRHFIEILATGNFGMSQKSRRHQRSLGMGVAVGDFNNDGYPDIFISNFGTARLYKNNGNSTFLTLPTR
jgi:hypothetical protein